VKPYLEKPFTKIGLVEWLQGVGPEFQLQYHQKKKKNDLNRFRFFRGLRWSVGDKNKARLSMNGQP
jgi:hypothetical protein